MNLIKMKFDTTLTLLENIFTDINVNWYYWYGVIYP